MICSATALGLLLSRFEVHLPAYVQSRHQNLPHHFAKLHQVVPLRCTCRMSRLFQLCHTYCCELLGTWNSRSLALRIFGPYSLWILRVHCQQGKIPLENPLQTQTCHYRHCLHLMVTLRALGLLQKSLAFPLVSNRLCYLSLWFSYSCMLIINNYFRFLIRINIMIQ